MHLSPARVVGASLPLACSAELPVGECLPMIRGITQAYRFLHEMVVLAERDAHTIMPTRGTPCEAMCWCQVVPHPVLYAAGNYISSNDEAWLSILAEEMDVGASFMTPRARSNGPPGRHA